MARLSWLLILLACVWLAPLPPDAAAAETIRDAEATPPASGETLDARRAEYHVMRDVALFSGLLLAVGLTTAFFRRSPPGEGYSSWGRVRTDSFQLPDLAMAGILLGLIGAAFAATPEPQGPPKELKMDLGTAISSLLFPLVMLGLVLIMAFWVVRRSPDEMFGLRRAGVGSVLLWTVLCGVPVILVVNGLGQVLVHYWLEPVFDDLEAQDPVKLLVNEKDPLVRACLVVGACVVAPVVEETMFRGYLYGVFKRYTGAFFAAFIVSLVFAVIHVKLTPLVPLWVLAMLLTWTYEKTGSLWVPIGIHALFNTATMVVLFCFPEATGG